MSREEYEKRHNDRLQQVIDEYMREDFPLPDIPEAWRDLPLPIDRPPVKYDFLDGEWLGNPGIMLERFTDENISALGRGVIPMLSSGFSGKGVATLFILAYHLKAPGTGFREFMFNLDGSMQLMQVLADKRYSEYRDRVTPANGYRQVITATGDPTREAAAYSYIAASLFRLFTKPASNYVKAWSHIVNGFSKFYAEKMRVMLPAPTEFALNHLKNYFNADAKVKATLYRFLYMSSSDARHKDLKEFLYDYHLSYTGMRIVNIFVQLRQVLNCSSESILTAINSKESENQVKCLVRILKLQTKNDENHRKKMWRYGRLFDEAFMSDLQTKSCPILVYILAEALRSAAPEKYSGILQIAQLADVNEDNKRRCAIAARCLLAQLKSQTGASSSGISYPKFGP